MIDLKTPLVLRALSPHALVIQSQALRDNPLKDSPKRFHHLLVPKGRRHPLVVHLSGYYSTGLEAFQMKALQRSFAEEIDFRTGQKQIAPMIHVFVDSRTCWGGSQFINSEGCGRHADHILHELMPALSREFPEAGPLILVGGSSGGYGALHLLSVKNSPFDQACAVAPDSFFEASLLPELRRMAPLFADFGYSVKRVRKALQSGEIFKLKDHFLLLHGLAMGHCYAPQVSFTRDELEFPLDLETGILNIDLWKKWCQWDPIEFLPRRLSHLKGKPLHLEVGAYDDYGLQFGARQIHKILKASSVKLSYQEFPGNHFGLSARKLHFLENL